MHGTVKEIQECTPFFKDFCLILILCQLVIDILKSNGLRIIITAYPANTIRKHSVEWNTLLCCLWNPIILLRFLNDFSYFFLFCLCQMLWKI